VKNQSQCYSHRGWMMRSHTELLWARVFDAAEIQYLHEPGLFNTPHGWYLPDFYMPNIEAYVEIKGIEPTEIEKEKAAAVILATGKPLVIISGKPNADRGGFCSCMAHLKVVDKWIAMPMCDFDQMYRRGMGELRWQRLIHAGMPGDESDVSSASEVLASFFLSGKLRKFYEEMAKKERDVTAAKLMASLPEPSIPELAIKEFFALLDERFNHKETP
jgi:hypothetical protein